jgi:hypothetical protein
VGKGKRRHIGGRSAPENECGSAGEDCSGSQSAMGQGEGGGPEVALSRFFESKTFLFAGNRALTFQRADGFIAAEAVCLRH